MYKVDFTQIKWVHFIGIGGISMSALAQILLSKKIKVTGSDNKPSDICKHLIEQGAEIFYPQSECNIQKGIELVVYTAAIHSENKEFIAAKEASIPMLTRAEFLGQLMTLYKEAICVSGTHGKTTTTSMISEILLETTLDPTIIVGGILNRINGNVKIGNSDTFITEACEYTNSFLSFFPTLGVILNVKEDHLDFFKDINDIRNSFQKFAKLIPSNGMLVINGDIENLDFFTKDLMCKYITYSVHNHSCNIYADNIAYDNLAHGSYDLYKDGVKLAKITLKVTGEHNISNSLAAIAASISMGIPLEKIIKGLDSYTGTDRRFQYKGSLHGITIIDDYAHHPDEIEATLSAALKYPHKKLWVVFQPHTYTRTKALFNRFAKTLSKADAVILADIYAARETDALGVSSELLSKEIEKLGTESHYFNSFDAIENFILENCISGDLVITMGAGDIVLIGNDLLGL